MADLIVGWANEERPESGSRLIAHLVARMGDVDPDAVVISRLCGKCGSADHGRPYASSSMETSPHVSLSRAGGMVIAAACNAGPVGIDLEKEVAAGSGSSTTLWVHKEALLKATGLGLSINPHSIHLDTSRKLVEWPTQIEDPGPWWLSDLDVPRGWLGAVVVLSASAPSLTLVGEVQGV